MRLWPWPTVGSFAASVRCVIDADGEVVFTTTMVGYQEVATDPSFRGQIVCMTYPLIGNYGIQADATNRDSRGWLVSSCATFREPSHADRMERSTTIWTRHGIPGSRDDTRALTLHIRDVGDTRGISSRMPQNSTKTGRSSEKGAAPGEHDVVGEVTAPSI